MRILFLIIIFCSLPVSGTAQTKVDFQTNSNISFDEFISGVKTINLISSNNELSASLLKIYNGIKQKLINKGFVVNLTKQDLALSSQCDEAYVSIAYNHDEEYFFDFMLGFASCNDDRWVLKSKDKVDLNDDDAINKILNIYKSLLSFSYNYESNKRLTKPQLAMTEFKSDSIIKIYFKNKINEDIEGIYELFSDLQSSQYSKYKIAVIQDKADEDKYNIIYLEGATNADDWTSGETKGYLYKTAKPNLYKTVWYMAYKDENKEVYSSLDGSGLLCVLFKDKTEPAKYLKLYPTKTTPQKNPSIGNVSKELIGTGSGFLVSNSGLVVTNYHVVEDATQIDIVFPIKGVTKKAKIKMKDVQNDIALLEIENFSLTEISSNNIPFSFADNNSVKVGQEVFTLGFPLGDIMGITPRLATGNINSLYGLQDDPRLFQINNSIQPGNSGGALFNKKGELVGICVSGLNAKYFYENQGIIPQNMNFAIKGSYLKNLIGMMPDGDTILKKVNIVNQGALEDLIEQLNPFIVQIRVY